MRVYDDLLPGTYVFLATYTPPYLTGDEQKTLRDMKIDFPDHPLTSNSLKFAKSQ